MSDEERYYAEHGVGPTRPVTPNPQAEAIAQRFVADINELVEGMVMNDRDRNIGMLFALTLASAATTTFLETGDAAQLALWEAIKERLPNPEPGQPFSVATTTDRSGLPPQR